MIGIPAAGSQRARSPLGAAMLGALVVLIVGGLLIETGSFGINKRTTVVENQIARPASMQTGGGLTTNDVYRRDAPGVAYVRAEVVQRTQSPFGGSQTQRGEATGSGFVIDDQGYILTNAHVVEGATNVTVQLGDTTMGARVVGSDTSADIAVLKVNTAGANLHPLALGDSSSVQVGDPVVAIGNPFGLDRTVTTGIVSALQREIQAPNGVTIKHVIQTDAAINPGNSGGPLIDSSGRVIGINSQIASTSGGSNGIAFAVPIGTAKKIADSLMKKQASGAAQS
jgi:S1-C subfamily serine protease